MSQTIAPKVEKLVMTRTYPVPVERVYNAWTDADLITKWMLPNERWLNPAVESEPVVGGVRNIEMRHSDGTSIQLFGEYLEVVPNQRLSFTWIVKDSPFGTENTLVTVEFREVAGGTEMTLTHDRHADEEARERTNGGWTGCLESLGKFLTESN